MKSMAFRNLRTAVAILLALTATLAVGSRVPGVSAHGTAAPALPLTSGPNLVVNGGFERGAEPGSQLALAAGTTLLTGWTVVNPGCCGVWYMGSAWQAEEGTRSLQLSTTTPGDLKSAGGVTQTITTTPGQKYLLSFYVAANPFRQQPWAVEVLVAGQNDTATEQADAQARAQHMEWVQHTLTFTARTSRTTLAFYAYQTCCNYGVGLDNVQVHRVAPPPTPTPVAGATPRTGVITGTLTLQLAWPAMAAGDAQAIQGTAGTKAAVALVVDYPDGTQLLAPLKAGADGHFTYTWKVPHTVHGIVHLLVDSASKTARGAFVVR